MVLVDALENIGMRSINEIREAKGRVSQQQSTTTQSTQRTTYQTQSNQWGEREKDNSHVDSNNLKPIQGGGRDTKATARVPTVAKRKTKQD